MYLGFLYEKNQKLKLHDRFILDTGGHDKLNSNYRQYVEYSETEDWILYFNPVYYGNYDKYISFKTPDGRIQLLKLMVDKFTGEYVYYNIDVNNNEIIIKHLTEI
jgi:hypothetical protein